MRVNKARQWCFTLNNFTATDESKLATFFDSHCKWMCFGREIAPETGTPHLQGVFYLNSQKSLRSIKKLMDISTLHLEVTRGSSSQNRDYVTKDKDFVEFGSMPQQGKRNDIDNVRDMVKANRSFLEVLDVSRSYQSARFAQLYMTARPAPPRAPGNKLYVYGPSGTGKSTLARSLFNAASLEYYVCDLDGWFDGYMGDTALLFDDFRSQSCPISRFLRILDPWSVRLPVKGASVSATSGHVTVTTVKAPWDLYVGEDSVQIIRRFDLFILTSESIFDIKALQSKIYLCPVGQRAQILILDPESRSLRPLKPSEVLPAPNF